MARLLPLPDSRSRTSGQSFAVMEVTAAGGPPVRYLVGRLGEDAVPLEEGGLPAAEGTLVPSLAADDQRVLTGLLEEITRHGPPDWEGGGEGRVARAWNLGANGFRRRVEEALEELEIRPLHPPSGTSSLTAVLPLSEPGLRLAPFHRGLRALPTFDEKTFLHLVAQYARVYELDVDLRTPQGRVDAKAKLASLATGHHAFLLVLPEGRARILRIRQALELSTIKAVPRNPTLRGLDLVLLESLVLRTVLGIRDPERADHPHLAAIGDFEALVDQVQIGVLQAGFALNPPPAWEVRAVMQVNEQLPARTLRLEPGLSPEALGYLPV